MGTAEGRICSKNKFGLFFLPSWVICVVFIFCWLLFFVCCLLLAVLLLFVVNSFLLFFYCLLLIICYFLSFCCSIDGSPRPAHPCPVLSGGSCGIVAQSRLVFCPLSPSVTTRKSVRSFPRPKDDTACSLRVSFLSAGNSGVGGEESLGRGVGTVSERRR